MKINEIIIENRIRKDMGDIEALKNSIREVGLLHLIVINEKNQLICGKRRLEALRQLGVTDLKEGLHYRIFNIEDCLRGEFEENFCRKDFSPLEAVAIWDATESHQGSHHQADSSQRRDKVAKSLGVGKDWLREAKAVRDAGDKHLINEMDQGHISVHRAYEQIMKNRTPQPIFLSKDRVELLLKGELTQISRTFGNWMQNDAVKVHMSNVAEIVIESVTERRLQDLTEEDAHAEGFRNLADYKTTWINHNNQWNPSDKVILIKFRLM
jgi:ParB family chromosome partitioning protein